MRGAGRGAPSLEEFLRLGVLVGEVEELGRGAAELGPDRAIVGARRVLRFKAKKDEAFGFRREAFVEKKEREVANRAFSDSAAWGASGAANDPRWIGWPAMEI